MRPIGVFDSGVGGVSVLRALQKELPLERFIYVADSGHAPYGERNDAHVIARAHAIADYLVAGHHIKALVVACNTATAAAIHQLRASYPDLPIIGIEPALKPAATSSQTRVVGVMATRGTLNSEKFQALLTTLHEKATFVLQPCDGLADAIEHADAIKIGAACAYYTRAMGQFGINSGDIDTLVLGCTHYSFVADELKALVGNSVQFFEGGAPVAKQTRRVLTERDQLSPAPSMATLNEPTRFYTTGTVRALKEAIKQWQHVDTDVEALTIPSATLSNRENLACPEGIEPPTLSLEG